MTITVTQLNSYIRGIFDIDAVLNDLSVCGEITNVKRSYNGWYFTLKDDSAAINCFCYANATEPVQGMMAVAEGQLNFYAKNGTVSFFARRLTATQNTGDAYRQFVELREKLRKEGLFDEERKKIVPRCAAKIGVVTSETGAVIHDIENVVHRRQPFSDIFLYPVKVQGEGADSEIAAGIEYFDGSDVDVVIVGRGGGSNEDLSAFNSEKVVRAIGKCRKPTVSAVGHGVDFTLSDFAADKRAVTPSEAAEFVTLDCEREKIRITSYLDKIGNAVEALLSRNFYNVENDCRLLYHGIGRKLDATVQTVKNCLSRSLTAVAGKVERARADLERNSARLDSVNPMRILKRGYAYVTTENKTVSSVDSLNVGDTVSVKFLDGKIDAQVTRKESEK